MEREEAINLLKKYNKEEFHLRHAFTVEGVMRYFAREKGYDEDFWGLVGLLHDIDFEQYPEEHCQKAPELLKELNDLFDKTILAMRDCEDKVNEEVENYRVWF